MKTYKSLKYYVIAFDESLIVGFDIEETLKNVVSALSSQLSVLTFKKGCKDFVLILIEELLRIQNNKKY